MTDDLTAESQGSRKVVARAFGAPLVVQGWTWLPLVEMATWAIMAWLAGRRRPERSLSTRLAVGAVTMPVVLGSEWCHNLAHAAAAKLVGKPTDEIRLLWGMPRLIYRQSSDRDVTPRQHVLRALGGPIFNAFLMPFALLLRRRARIDSVTRDVADAALGVNAFLCTVSLLPIPGIDGGPILKWTLIGHGRKPTQADAIVHQVDGALGAGMAIGAALAFRKRRWFTGSILALFAALATAIATGLVKEKPPQ